MDAWTRFPAETSRSAARLSTVVTLTGARGFVIAGSEDGGSVVANRVCARVVYFHRYTVGKEARHYVVAL